MYAKRNAAGELELISRLETPECSEYVPMDSPELLSFLGGEGEVGKAHFQTVDLAFVRVLEDLLQVLMDKGVISFTDLPEPAQQKLMERQSLRRHVNDVGLMDENEDSGVI